MQKKINKFFYKYVLYKIQILKNFINKENVDVNNNVSRETYEQLLKQVFYFFKI